MSAFQIEVKEIEVKSKGIISYVRVNGFLDAHTFEQMEQALSDLFKKGQYRIIIDLEKVDYISSAGAGVFIGAIGTAKDNHGNIILLKPSDNIKEVFDLLGLTQIFKFASTLEEAHSEF